MLKRPVNVGFSGGEKKRNEMVQMGIIDPKLAILDETDSGLDIDALRVVGDGINRIMRAPDKAVLLITHYQRLLDYVQPDFVHVLADGRIVRSGGPELAHELEARRLCERWRRDAACALDLPSPARRGVALVRSVGAAASAGGRRRRMPPRRCGDPVPSTSTGPRLLFVDGVLDASAQPPGPVQVDALDAATDAPARPAWRPASGWALTLAADQRDRPGPDRPCRHRRRQPSARAHRARRGCRSRDRRDLSSAPAGPTALTQITLGPRARG